LKRLRKKLATLVQRDFRKRRTNRRLLFAEWVPADINDPNIIQYVTDVMSSGGNVQIEYNGEWKTIAPYGWNSSKEGNVLLMCYKDTGEVRSYRLDRITNVQFDSDTMDTSMFAPGGEEDGSTDSEEIMVDGLEVPTLPEEQQFGEDQGPKAPESPFETAIETLEDASDEPQTMEPEPQQDLNQDINEIKDQNEIEDQNEVGDANVFVPEEIEEENKQPVSV
jgi:hypothetical protein